MMLEKTWLIWSPCDVALLCGVYSLEVHVKHSPAVKGAQILVSAVICALEKSTFGQTNPPFIQLDMWDCVGHALLVLPELLQQQFEVRKIQIFPPQVMEGEEMCRELNVNNLQILISATKRISRVCCCSDPGSWTRSGEVGMNEKWGPQPRSGGNGKVCLVPWEVRLRGGSTGAWRKQGCRLLRNWSLDVVRQRQAPPSSGGPKEGSLGLPVNKASACCAPFCSVTVLLLQPHYMEIER